ncbi:HAD hydrolase-like protein [Sphaerisporangium sp. NPDC051017]|uniref:HAD family hydrolase n=1 Tax=Sphaerisporangium sp. NPDC051017 TaxID=3154636 RepID=UPI00343AA225
MPSAASGRRGRSATRHAVRIQAATSRSPARHYSRQAEIYAGLRALRDAHLEQIRTRYPDIWSATRSAGFHLDADPVYFDVRGDDVRSELVRISLGRATSILGETVTPSDAVLIGDTPADVEAALENGVPVIAVASGRSSADELREAGALRVLPDLTDTASVVKMVLEEATA